VEPDHIHIRGAREHNLKGIDVSIPKKRLVVLTGVSGSGKSSLAFDTLFAEGQRRYVESLSAYARQFLGQMEKPHYDAITGLSPTIAIEQKTASANPRSTVGTVTEIYDYLRVLYARAGVQHCTQCERPVGRQTVDQIVDSLLDWPDGTRFTLLSPVARNRKGEFKGIFEQARRDGFVRVRLDGVVRDLSDDLEPDKKRKHDVDIVVDRIALREGIRSRLTDSVEMALRYGDGVVMARRADDDDEIVFSERNHCASCDLSFPELSPQMFSFNTPLGMCPACHGLGTTMAADEDKIVPNPEATLDAGAVAPWANHFGATGASWTGDIVAGVCEAFAIATDVPWSQLTGDQRRVLLYGADERVEVKWERERGSGSYKKTFEGVANTLLRRWRETKSEEMRGWYEQYLTAAPCPDCEGSRLRPEARHVTVGGVSMPTLTRQSVEDLLRRFESLELQGQAAVVAEEVLREIRSRLAFLARVGLGYLDLGRTASTLSGGESQRIRLASQIGTELTGVIYILDEPSIGLHARDNGRLIEALCRLRDIGNSVLVVEHDEEMMRAADWILDFGPGAGVLGGEVVAQGTLATLIGDPRSLTGAYLSGARGIAVPAKRRQAKHHLTVLGATENNLKGVDVAFPLGVFTVVTGVSGAGKSSLVAGVLRPALERRLNGAGGHVGRHGAITGLEHLDKIVSIDQRPIGRTPRSNPATYTKLFDEIRTVFAQTKEARAFGYGAGRFSFNVKGGRCEACSGAGVVKVEMHFLADVYVTCDSCGGSRFNEATLRVRYKGKTIAEALDMTVAEALEFLANHKKAHRIAQTLMDVGLGYVALGQPSTTLSGGEAQRVKLSRELAKVQTGSTFYVLDEPSTGLHFADIERLLEVIERLVAAGNTVVMVEHNLDIIKRADHVIDLGPDGGHGGGQVVASGTPEQVAAAAGSYTGAALAGHLARPRI
jgi:excinuclease ABC subunit A